MRFGEQPKLFSAPVFPTWNDTSIQNSSYGPACYQIDLSELKPPNPNRGPSLPDFRAPLENLTQCEDCLFLDVYAPRSAFGTDGKPAKNLPVVVWFYGGAYAFGAKELGASRPLYTGQSMLTAAQDDIIFVAGNYRLGAFGWLAGSYMQSVGQPNAGLYDQALLLEWVNKYISRAGGDPRSVSAWGESAGGSSILHHLVREGGTKDPLFKNFLVQSPAYEWSWDNKKDGTLDQMYQAFSSAAGCGSTYDIDCLRNVGIGNLTRANKEIYDLVHIDKIFPVGPSIDGEWIQTLPTISLTTSTFCPASQQWLQKCIANSFCLKQTTTGPTSAERSSPTPQANPSALRPTSPARRSLIASCSSTTGRRKRKSAAQSPSNIIARARRIPATTRLA